MPTFAVDLDFSSGELRVQELIVVLQGLLSDVYGFSGAALRCAGFKGAHRGYFGLLT